MKHKTWLASLAVMAVAAAGCGTSDNTEAEPQSAATEPAAQETSETESEPAGGGSGIDQWGNGVWPEGYSFELPRGITLQDEVIDAAVDGDAGGEARRPYRRITLEDKMRNPLREAPYDMLVDQELPRQWVEEGMKFAANFYLEHVMDSFVLMKNFTPELEQEWIDSVSHLTVEDFADYALNELEEEDLARRIAVTITRDMGILWPEGESESGEASSGDDEDQLGIQGLVHDDGDTRLANVEVSIIDFKRLENGLFYVGYDSNQTLLLNLAAGDGQELHALTIDQEYYLTYYWDGEDWVINSIYPNGIGWEWDKDITA